MIEEVVGGGNGVEEVEVEIEAGPCAPGGADPEFLDRGGGVGEPGC